MTTATIVLLLIAFYFVPLLCRAHWSQIRPRRRNAMRLAVRALKNSTDWSRIPLAKPDFWDGRVLLDDGSQVIVQLEYGFTKPRDRAWFRVTNENQVARLRQSAGNDLPGLGLDRQAPFTKTSGALETFGNGTKCFLG